MFPTTKTYTPRRTGLFVLSLMLLCALLSVAVSANAAEPPCLTVVVVNAPDDLSLSMRNADGSAVETLEVRTAQRGWETYYRFEYTHIVPNPSAETDFSQMSLSVAYGDTAYTCPLPAEAYDTYSNVLQLNLETQTLTADISPGRTVLLVGMRVLLTLLLEGVIFWGFHYREKRSWLVFLFVNLATQAFVNFAIGGGTMDSYVLFFYCLCEAIVILAECILFPIFLREKKKYVCILYAVIANLASMFVGGLMISYLPVAL